MKARMIKLIINLMINKPKKYILNNYIIIIFLIKIILIHWNNFFKFLYFVNSFYTLEQIEYYASIEKALNILTYLFFYKVKLVLNTEI